MSILGHRYTDLAAALIWREIVVRYKRSVLGVLWALVEPLFVVLVYTIVFGHILGAAEAGGGAERYPFFVVFGVLPWLFFSSTLESGAGVLLEHSPLARKVYFPWELLLLAVLVSRLSTLVVGCIAALALALGASVFIDDLVFAWSRLPYMLLGVVLLSMLSWGISIVAAAVLPILRDTAFILRFGLRLAFYACPVVYPASMVPADWRTLYDLNPLVGVLWCFQTFATPGPAPERALVAAVLCATVSLVAGTFVFRKLRPLVADVL